MGVTSCCAPSVPRWPLGIGFMWKMAIYSRRDYVPSLLQQWLVRRMVMVVDWQIGCKELTIVIVFFSVGPFAKSRIKYGGHWWYTPCRSGLGMEFESRPSFLHFSVFFFFTIFFFFVQCCVSTHSYCCSIHGTSGGGVGG